MSSVKLIDIEPSPRSAPLQARIDRKLSYDEIFEFPTPRKLPSVDFSMVLENRRSLVGEAVSTDDLGDLLFHTMRKRRGGIGRFGRPWEGRVAPSAGGLHPIKIVVVPLNNEDPAGFYCIEGHCLKRPTTTEIFYNRNAQSVEELTSATAGFALQFVADPDALTACYESWESLLWRDSGALAATISLIATAIGLVTVILGRTGRDLISEESWANGLIGAGAVYVGRRR
ncbi:nitroreductase family protein [Radicibacter daui]|uniref:nitroreductase family protein n=1 Tax=Radicibacter daui TaxID=3064829 RepID=UPI004046AD97